MWNCWMFFEQQTCAKGAYWAGMYVWAHTILFTHTCMWGAMRSDRTAFALARLMLSCLGATTYICIATRSYMYVFVNDILVYDIDWLWSVCLSSLFFSSPCWRTRTCQGGDWDGKYWSQEARIGSLTGTYIRTCTLMEAPPYTWLYYQLLMPLLRQIFKPSAHWDWKWGILLILPPSLVCQMWHFCVYNYSN